MSFISNIIMEARADLCVCECIYGRYESPTKWINQAIVWSGELSFIMIDCLNEKDTTFHNQIWKQRKIWPLWERTIVLQKAA